jgi:hypothetical protein
VKALLRINRRKWRMSGIHGWQNRRMFALYSVTSILKDLNQRNRLKVKVERQSKNDATKRSGIVSRIAQEVLTNQRNWSKF